MRENAKRATMKDLIAHRIAKEARDFKVYDIYVPSMDATLPFRKPPESVLFDTIDEMGDGGVRESMGAMKHLIYRTCELLQDPALQQELNVKDPFDTVEALFDLADISSISEQLTNAFGMGEVEERAKNESGATQD